MEKLKSNLEEQYKRKESELNITMGKLNEQQSLNVNTQKKLKDALNKLAIAEEEVQFEKQQKMKAESLRYDTQRLVDELNKRIDEASIAVASQIEVTKKRDDEMAVLKAELERQRLQSDSNTAHMAKRHQEQLNEISLENERLQRDFKK